MSDGGRDEGSQIVYKSLEEGASALNEYHSAAFVVLPSFRQYQRGLSTRRPALAHSAAAAACGPLQSKLFMLQWFRNLRWANPLSFMTNLSLTDK